MKPINHIIERSHPVILQNPQYGRYPVIGWYHNMYFNLSLIQGDKDPKDDIKRIIDHNMVPFEMQSSLEEDKFMIVSSI